MNEEKINKMCSDIYQGEDWQPMKDYIKSLQAQLQQKENIIKEVREYMKTLSDEYAKDDYDIKCDVFNKLYYEILDKEEVN